MSYTCICSFYCCIQELHARNDKVEELEQGQSGCDILSGRDGISI